MANQSDTETEFRINKKDSKASTSSEEDAEIELIRKARSKKGISKRDLSDSDMDSTIGSTIDSSTTHIFKAKKPTKEKKKTVEKKVSDKDNEVNTKRVKSVKKKIAQEEGIQLTTFDHTYPDLIKHLQETNLMSCFKDVIEIISDTLTTGILSPNYIEKLSLIINIYKIKIGNVLISQYQNDHNVTIMSEIDLFLDIAKSVIDKNIHFFNHFGYEMNKKHSKLPFKDQVDYDIKFLIYDNKPDGFLKSHFLYLNKIFSAEEIVSYIDLVHGMWIITILHLMICQHIPDEDIQSKMLEKIHTLSTDSNACIKPHINFIKKQSKPKKINSKKNDDVAVSEDLQKISIHD